MNLSSVWVLNVAIVAPFSISAQCVGFGFFSLSHYASAYALQGISYGNTVAVYSVLAVLLGVKIASSENNTPEAK